jgi:hypothetical protein
MAGTFSGPQNQPEHREEEIPAYSVDVMDINSSNNLVETVGFYTLETQYLAINS